MLNSQYGKHVEEIKRRPKIARPLISKETAIQIYAALIMPHFDNYEPHLGLFD